MEDLSLLLREPTNEDTESCTSDQKFYTPSGNKGKEGAGDDTMVMLTDVSGL